MSDVLIYGATGYSGQLIARRAVSQGLKPVLAGRSSGKLEPIAQELGLESRVFALDEELALREGLQGTKVVVHCAGPFSHTSRPMVKACLATGTHYLDITGEAQVFEAAAARDDKAQAAGVMLLPGVGFDVVPSDCLAAHLKGRLPDATHLALGFQGMSGMSQGTAKTMAENVHRGGLVRRDGVLVRVPTAYKKRLIDFGLGPRSAITIPWGDVSTAFHSTGIPDIEVYVPVTRSMQFGLRLTRYVGWLLATRPMQRLMKSRIEAGPPGPNEEEREKGKSYLWGEVRNAAGEQCVSRLVTPEGYKLTAHAAVEIARRVLAGEAKPGFQTPSRAFGADFVLSLEGVSRTDEPPSS